MFLFKIEAVEREGQNYFTFYIEIEADTEKEAKEKIKFILQSECDVLDIIPSR